MNAVLTKERTLDIGIDDECPICARLRDPVTGALPYNAETIASIEEGRAMRRGEIPAKRFSSLAEMLEDLGSDEDDGSVTFQRTSTHSDLDI